MMKTPSRGLALIEVLVGMLIISFGLMGLLTLQARALQTSVVSDEAQRAAMLASEMAAEMFNQNNVAISASVVNNWAARVADPASGGLPGGTGTVTVSATNANLARVQLTWTSVQRSGAPSDTHTYATDVVIP